MLHLDRIKEDCRQTVTSNTSLWARDALHKFPLPPQDIVDFLCLNDCSGHGHCSAGETSVFPGLEPPVTPPCCPGLCLCADGWEGADCSVDLATGPRVANLGNNGLCDVRSKPCKSLIVSGDNFANNAGLVCHFEVFKVIHTYNTTMQCLVHTVVSSLYEYAPVNEGRPASDKWLPHCCLSLDL